MSKANEIHIDASGALLDKIASSIKNAQIQMLAFAAGRPFDGVVFLEIQFDHFPGDYDDGYIAQIKRHLQSKADLRDNRVSSIRIIARSKSLMRGCLGIDIILNEVM